MIVLSDDELPHDPGTFGPPLAPPPPGGVPEEVHLTRARSASSSSGTTITIEYNYTHMGARKTV